MSKQLFQIQRNKTGISFNRVKRSTAMKTCKKTMKKKKSSKGKRGKRRKSRKLKLTKK